MSVDINETSKNKINTSNNNTNNSNINNSNINNSNISNSNTSNNDTNNSNISNSNTSNNNISNSNLVDFDGKDNSKVQSNKPKVSKNPVQSAERIFNVMETLAETGPIGLMELSGRLDLHKSTTHRLLLSLIYMGYVIQDEDTGKYKLTFKIVGLSEKILSKIDIASMVHPLLEKLANECKETVHFVQRRGTDVIYLDKVTPIYSQESAIRMASQVGLARPMYCSGVGKAILAEMTAEDVAYIWKNSIVEKKTEYTITTLAQLMEELEDVRQKGYALDNEENEIGVRCIAACVRNHKGEPENAFSISAPAGRMTEERILQLAEDMIKTKETMKKVLGH